MDTPFLIAQIPLVIFIAVFVYIIVLRKNDFEKRLEFYTPNHSLPQERQLYLKGMKRYIKYASIFIIGFFIFPILILLVFLYTYFQDTSMFWFFFSFILIEAAAIYLLLYIFKRNVKGRQMLLEQMTDDDFHLLLSFQREWFFINRYSPSFVFCRNKLYLFSVFSIIETDARKVEKVNWLSSKGGNRTVFVKADKRTVIKMPKNVYLHFVDILKKYNPNADIEK